MAATNRTSSTGLTAPFFTPSLRFTAVLPAWRAVIAGI